MKKSLFLLISISVLCLLSACGGGSGSTGIHVGPAAHFSVSAPGNATVGTAVNFMVTALDASNNVVTSYHGTLQFTSNDAQALLPASTTLTNGAGVFSATLNTSGIQTITATDTVTPAVTGTSSAIEVSAASNGTFTPTGTMTFARAGHTATLLQNGTVLIAGGENSTGPLISAEIYDPSTGMFTTIGSMGTARVGHTATLLSDGTVLVAGGNDTTAPLATAEIFNPLNGSFTPTTGNMGAARVGHTATLLSDGTGRVLIAGGGSMMLEVLFGPVSDPGTASAELYDPKSGQFTPAANNMVASRIYHTATLLTNGEVLLAGGTNSGSALGDLFSPSTAMFTATTTGGTASLHLAAALLRNKDVVFTGGDLESSPCGIGANWVSVQNALLFDINGAGFSETGDMLTSRVSQTATLLRSGEVLIAGGATSSTPCNRGFGTSTFDSVASAELFNTGGTFVLTGSMSTARAGQTATLLGNGQVLVAGGANGNAKAANALSSAELYQ